jgi:NAD(P)-dependent dehydrogenase (short-subunit alcohol dehydrogenase family)
MTSSNPEVVGMDHFTSIEHSNVTAATDPSNVTLPSPFVVCIIGASSGIGEHIAYAYAKAGASGIIVSSRRTSELERVSQNIKELNANAKVLVASCDITSADSVEALAEKVKSIFGRVDVVIPNSGYAGPVTLKVTEGEPEWFRQNFDVNTVGTYHAAHYFIPLLLESPEGAKSFFVVGSLAADIIGGPIANTGYCLSKMAQSRLVEYIGEQFGKDGLLAVSIHPGAVMTPMAAGNTPDEFLPYLVDAVGLCGAFCVWLSKEGKSIQWLSGRFISANWDTNELLAKKVEVIEKDLLKWRIATS